MEKQEKQKSEELVSLKEKYLNHGIDVVLNEIMNLKRNAQSINESIIASEKYDMLILLIWKKIDSDDCKQKRSGWNDLNVIRRNLDAGRTLLFCRMCWFKCKENPLLFYKAYLNKISNTIEYYELASQHDNTAFEQDKVDNQEVASVLKKVIESINDYNKANGIDNDEVVKAINKYFEKRIRYKKNFEKKYINKKK